MKIKLKCLLILVIISISSGNFLMAQSKLQYAIISQHPVFYKLRTSNNHKVSLYEIGVETNWTSKSNKYLHYSTNLLYGRYRYSYSYSPDLTFNEQLVEIGFSVFLGSKNHYFEFGTGLDSRVLLKAIIGYRLNLGDHFLFKLQIMPSTYYYQDLMNDADEKHKFLDIGVTLGYQFNQKNSDAILTSFAFIGNRLSIQAMTYPISFDEPGSIIPSLVFDLDFSLFKLDNLRFSIHGGSGFLLEGYVFSQLGLNYLYGMKNHFLEVSTNLCFTQLSNPNLEWLHESDYRLLQVQLGYRYQCQKIPMFARIAYTPYIRTLDWKREGGLHHNMVLGLGYRFGK